MYFSQKPIVIHTDLKKRIFLSHREGEQKYFKKLACTTELNLDQILTRNIENSTADIIEPWILHGQKTPALPYTFRWNDYKLLSEGHYTQIWSHYNWDMYLPFVGEGDHISAIDIFNKEIPEDTNSDPGSPVTIPDTHRDLE